MDGIHLHNGWCYVNGRNDETGEFAVFRFRVEEMFKDKIHFQTLFTWEWDEGNREKTNERDIANTISNGEGVGTTH